MKTRSSVTGRYIYKDTCKDLCYKITRRKAQESSQLFAGVDILVEMIDNKNTGKDQDNNIADISIADKVHVKK